ncbi:MAG: hypothetical protein N4A46_13445 [Schleiferiaceae bacterium]|nr:hypothetical protein [Schleiferiaceae bacterium]
MKRFKNLVLSLFAVLIASPAFAQINLQPDLQYYRMPGYDGLNVFETGKLNDVEYDGFKVRVGGDFALQFQAINHQSDWQPGLVTLGSNVNLPSANLNIDAQLLNGMRMHLRTYLSSKHHNEAWVKGGYILVDRLDFIKEGFGDRFMDIFSFKIGMDDINYGDAHFRRSDNAMAIYNPFVGNYIMDAFTTEPFIEVYAYPADFIVMVAVNNGYLNPTVVKTQTSRGTGNVTGEADNKVTFYSKLGWDSQVSEKLRVRITGSFYNAPGFSNGNHLYNGDRAGSRYYNVMDALIDNGDGTQSVFSSDFSGRFNPGFNSETAFQINPFVKFQGLEFFGIFEQTSGYNGGTSENLEKGSYTQIGAELLYRFGSWDQFYVGGRYNTVSGNGSYVSGTNAPGKLEIDRFNVGFGWFMTKNAMIKIEYVNQNYNENFNNPFSTFANNSAHLQNGNFNGAVIEAVLGF